MSNNITEDYTRFKVTDFIFRNDGVPTGDFIFFDEEKCDGCGDCGLVCSVNLWAVPSNGKTKLSSRYRELCLECAACYAMCEKDAINFRYPDGGSGIIIKHG